MTFLRRSILCQSQPRIHWRCVLKKMTQRVSGLVFMVLSETTSVEKWAIKASESGFWIVDCILTLEVACCCIAYILCTPHDNLVNKDILSCPQKINNSCKLTTFFTSLKPNGNRKWKKFQRCQCGHFFPKTLTREKL